MIRFSNFALTRLLLVVSLALATSATAAKLPQPKPRAASYSARSLRVVPSGWRLELTTLQGACAIVRLDPAGRPSHYAGEGMCQKWSQQQLGLVYMSIVRSLDVDHMDLPTVG